MRRRWIARIGWYPGDWVWLSLATLAVAAAGAAVAIAVSEHRQSAHRGFETVAGDVSLREPATQVPTGQTPTPRVDTSKLPTAPEPGNPAAGNGRTAWPANETGWTIVLVSYPKTFGHPQALDTATKAAKKGLNQVGIVDSSQLREPPARLLRRLRRDLRLTRRGGRRGRHRPPGRFPGAYSRADRPLRCSARPRWVRTVSERPAFTNLETFVTAPLTV